MIGTPREFIHKEVARQYVTGMAPALAGMNPLDRPCFESEIGARLMISKRTLPMHELTLAVIKLPSIVVVILRIIPGVA
ncbi:MAG: hypothetical protein K1X65_01365 [Caldilineales bacterium]|nr:hypothetical protein [Caldilineales bacterium]MCW5857298.1 hypothetical protein [Caldilineales bacterium]